MSRPSGASVVLASAGTGKTWRLTTHFLALLASEVAPERCLATTFTRKAAAEILGRVFARLVAASRDEAKRVELDGAIGGFLGSRDEVVALLERLARRIERFRVRTLDAYFVELARSLAPAIGLPPDWRIVDDFAVAGVREAAIGAALERGGIARWTAILREMTRVDSSRAVHATLTRTVVGAHQLYLDAPPEAWERLRPPQPLDPDSFALALARLRDVRPPLTKQGEPSEAWRKALIKALATAECEDWKAFAKDGVAEKVLCGEGAYSRMAIEADAREAFEVLLRHAAARVGAALQRGNRATRGMLDDFDREYRARMLERGAVRFEDVPRALVAAGSDATRVGSLEHLLLDEFQDTAPAQWRVLEPSVLGLAADRAGATSVFCVGDVKQSIYGWRSADPRLLESLPRRLGVEAQELSKSYRSAPAVLDLVNRVFARLGSNAAFESKPELAPVASSFEARFREHVADKPDLRGAVRVHVAADGAGEDEHGEVRRALAPERQRKCLERAVVVVAKLQSLAPRATIGVLVRHVRFIGALVYLLRERGIAASGETGNPLTDSHAVQVALSALHFADHPSDTAARFHVATSSLGRVLGLAPDADLAADFERARELRAELVERGYAATLERFRAAFADASGWERARFERLIELAIAWRAELSLRPSEFVRRVREQRVEDPSAAAVKVMTIHAAKGLEFDAVVCPELDFPFSQKTPAWVWRREDDDPTRPIEALSRGVDAGVRELLRFGGDPLLDDLHVATARRALADELCALYVAMTRARRALELVIAPRTSAKPTASAAGVLRAALGCEAIEPDTLAWSSTTNDDSWVDDFAPLSTPRERPQSAEDRPIVFRAPAKRRELERVSPSALAHRGRVPLRELFAPRERARARGLRQHLWLEQIEWLEDFVASDAELADLARARGLGGDGLAADLAGFRAALARPELRALLERAGRPADVEIWRERGFARVRPGARGVRELEHGSFDRVALVRERGEVVRAEVIDFKTDAIDGEHALAERAEHYRPQLAAYRQALAELCGVDLERTRAKIAFLGAGRVLDLEPSP